jgi:hypothetical protein
MMFKNLDENWLTTSRKQSDRQPGWEDVVEINLKQTGCEDVN